MILIKRCTVYGVQIYANQNPVSIDDTYVYFFDGCVDVSQAGKPVQIGTAYIEYSGNYDEHAPALEGYKPAGHLLDRNPYR